MPDMDGAMPSTITGAVIKRTRNTTALDITGADAFDVVLGHLAEKEKTYAERKNVIYVYYVTKTGEFNDTMPNSPDDLDRAAKGLLPLAKVIEDVRKASRTSQKSLCN